MSNTKRPGGWVKVQNLIRLARPRHYAKNLLILAPLFFGLEFENIALLQQSLLAFVAFSLAASAIYSFNDLIDAESDRRHPVKQNRPIAAGQVSPQVARIFMLALLIGAWGITLWLPNRVILWIGLYVVLNLAYSIRLKHMAILDVFLISLGFLLRLEVGSTATGIPLSTWIVLLTFMLALFIGLAKRRDDILLKNSGKTARAAIDGYNMDFVNHGMAVMAAVTTVAYIMYTLSPQVEARLHSEHIYLTVIFVVLGLLRYMQRALVENDTGSPVDILFRDRFIQLTVLGWVFTLWALLYW